MTLSAFSGLLMENTTRGAGWRFLEIGRRLERALQMAELLRAGVAEVPVDAEPCLHLLLQIADSSITYRTRYLSLLRTDLVLQLLLADESNPRSVAFQLAAVVQELDSLGERDDPERCRLEGLASKTYGQICVALIDELARRDGEGRFAALDFSSSARQLVRVRRGPDGSIHEPGEGLALDFVLVRKHALPDYPFYSVHLPVAGHAVLQ